MGDTGSLSDNFVDCDQHTPFGIDTAGETLHDDYKVLETPQFNNRMHISFNSG